MAYQINKTDGTIVATVADGQIDTLSTDLTLIGKNYSGFGDALNENFVKLLENFANTIRPENPIRGQLWFDTSELKLKVYSGIEFLPVSSATISTTQPTTLGVGDLWFNSIDKQLYFYDGTNSLLLGPIYSNSQSLSGLKVESILDTQNQTRVITSLYNNGLLLGIFANATFTPKVPIVGYTGSLGPGFNAGDLSGIKFDVTCTNAEQLNNVSATNYVRKDTLVESIQGTFAVVNDGGISIGTASSGILDISNGNISLTNTASDKNISFSVRRGIGQENAITISSSNRAVSIYPSFTDSLVTLGGSLVVTGDLTVEGTTTTINTSTMSIEDKNIELAKGSTSDATADGGGITLKGTTDHTIIWSASTTNWNSSEHMNLAVNKEYKIDGVTVLSGTSLGAGITSIPGVSSFGKQIRVRIGPGLATDLASTEILLEDNRISTVQTNRDLELEPNGTGNIALIGSPRITGMSDPSAAQDAATKEYVDNAIESETIRLTVDLSDGKPNSYIISNILNNMCPPVEHRNGTVARVLCNILTNSTTSLDINPLVSQSTATFDQPGGGTALAVTNVSVSTATVSAPGITVTRIIKEFILTGNPKAWQWYSDNILPA